MGANSGIAWTTHTFNPWLGCQHISPGCKHCYAEEYVGRVSQAKQIANTWGVGPRVRTGQKNWNQPKKWDLVAKAAGERHRVFCASLSDVFEQRAELAPWRTDLFALIRQTPHLDWLLLTKRPASIMPFVENAVQHARHGTYAVPRNDEPLAAWLEDWLVGNAPHNVWLGTTVEDQRRADERIPKLLAAPARVHFLSCEPLLERVTLPVDTDEIDWLIVGGESGGLARPFALEWARYLVKQCRERGIAPFVKQLGAKPVAPVTEGGGVALGSELKPVAMKLVDIAGGDPAEWPEDLRIREFPEVR